MNASAFTGIETPASRSARSATARPATEILPRTRNVPSVERLNRWRATPIPAGRSVRGATKRPVAETLPRTRNVPSAERLRWWRATPIPVGRSVRGATERPVAETLPRTRNVPSVERSNRLEAGPIPASRSARHAIKEVRWASVLSVKNRKSSRHSVSVTVAINVNVAPTRLHNLPNKAT
jgi:hypothetical protein